VTTSGCRGPGSAPCPRRRLGEDAPGSVSRAGAGRGGPGGAGSGPIRVAAGCGRAFRAKAPPERARQRDATPWRRAWASAGARHTEPGAGRPVASVAEFVGALEAGVPSEHCAESPRIVGLHDDVESGTTSRSPGATGDAGCPMGVLGLLVVVRGRDGMATGSGREHERGRRTHGRAPLLRPGQRGAEVSPPRVGPSPTGAARAGVTGRNGPRRGRACPRGPRRLRARPAARPWRRVTSSSTRRRGGQVYLDGVLIGNTPRGRRGGRPRCAPACASARDGFQSLNRDPNRARQELRLTTSRCKSSSVRRHLRVGGRARVRAGPRREG